MKRSGEKTEELVKKGINIIDPDSVIISPEVSTARIEKGVTIYPGCRIKGENTLILKGSSIGTEGPVTLNSCYIGEDVEIKSGFSEKSVFLDKVSIGSNAHIRGGTILEEEASCAHTVGLKQTILFPFVTLGSLINFCDCFMAGGTSRKDHSEVGSSYIHFNYTPNQDKATASLLGDVPKGVMLKSTPIFLGGQGGLVGPCRLTYGNVVAAGTIQRKDELRENRLLFGGLQKSGNIPFKKSFAGIPGIVEKNIIYIANLKALNQWYRSVRSLFMDSGLKNELLWGLKETLNSAIDERVKRLKDYFEKAVSANFKKDSTGLIKEIYEGSDLLCSFLKENDLESELKEQFLAEFIKIKNDNYIDSVKALSFETSEKGRLWLEEIIVKYMEKTKEILPSLKFR